MNKLFVVLPAMILFSACTTVTVHDSSRNEELRDSMRRVQVITENYAANHGGETYPLSIDNDFKCYFPGGSEGGPDEEPRPAPFGPVNVFTGRNEFPSVGKIKDLRSVRFGIEQRMPLKPGEILYCPLEQGKAYAILGGGHDGKALLDDKNPGQVLVFSNLDDD